MGPESFRKVMFWVHENYEDIKYKDVRMIIDCAIGLHFNFFRLDKIEVFSSLFISLTFVDLVEHITP